MMYPTQQYFNQYHEAATNHWYDEFANYGEEEVLDEMYDIVMKYGRHSVTRETIKDFLFKAPRLCALYQSMDMDINETPLEYMPYVAIDKQL